MKERLTGAIILVALIVLLVPELLTGPIGRKPARVATISYSLPATHPEPPIRTYTLTLGKLQPTPQSDAGTAAQPPSQPAREAAPESSAQPHPSAPPAAPARETARAVPAHGAAPRSGGLQGAKSPTHQAVQEAHSPASSGGWVVQLGSFASRQNADRLARSLRGKGFRTTVSPGRAGTRVLWRVRAGPTRDRAGALRLAARLKALGHRGELIPLR